MRSWIGVALGIAAGLLYLYVGFPKAGTDSHYLFAQAFLDGRLYIEGSYPWLELVPRAEGGWYTPFPPLLSTALIPFAAAGIEVDTNVISAVMGGISVALVLSLPQGEIGDTLLTVTYIVVVFSVLVQGLTIGPLVRSVAARAKRDPGTANSRTDG